MLIQIDYAYAFDKKTSKLFHCAWSDDGICDEMEGYECSNYNKYQISCKSQKHYIYKDKQCQRKKCSDITKKENCNGIGYLYEIWLCIWKNDACFDKTQEEYNQPGDCEKYFRWFYRNEQGECQKCQAESLNNSIQTNNTDDSINLTNQNSSDLLNSLSNHLEMINSIIAIFIGLNMYL